MKKILLFLGLFVAACNAVNSYDTEFKNPVFNQPLEPLSKIATWTYLTPTTYISMTPLDKNKVAVQGKCDLIENKQDRITLKCQLEGWGRTYNQYYTYIVEKLSSPNCLLIGEYDYNKPEEFPKFASYATYCVLPPKDMTSEFN